MLSANKMTQHTDSLDNAIAKTGRDFPGGVKSLAKKLSVNPGTLYNKFNPGMPSHRLTLQEALDTMRHSQDVRILEVLCRKTHHACVSQIQFRNTGDMALFDAWTASDIEHGRTAEVIRSALSDEQIDKDEFRGIRSEMFIDFARGLELLDRLNIFSSNPLRKKPPATTDLKQAIFETVQQYPDGLPHLARKLDMRETDLRKKADPDLPNEFPSIHDALKLMQVTENFSLLDTTAHQLNHTCIAIPRYDGDNDMALLDAWSSWSDERSDTISAIHQALNDGEIDQDEIAGVEVNMFRDFETELALLARLRSMIP
ncbi:hypothetical protein MNBD_GAMMA15-1491 [hydrothermal vent metagenome]|uniref:Uncharacterized protein n=1 Tax=hydrothermal vent metagenome TaxID=652676 RepID=A0A3B0YW08_9ZZZZ